MIRHLKLPDKLDLFHILQFAHKIDRIGKTDEVVVELGRTRHFPPFSMLFLAAKFLELKEANPDLKITAVGGEEHTYPGHMGFFKAIGVPIGMDIGEAPGSARYLPIRALYREDLKRQDRYAELGDLIQKHADEIAEMVSRDASHKTDLFNALSYSLREIIRNAFEHSECDRVLYCGQYWPMSSKVEVSILDRGIGIRQSLGTNPNFRYGTDKQALEMSLLPSVSGKTHLPARSETWGNSGYGLYMTSRLCRHGGNFVIASGNAAIGLSKTLEKKNFNTSLQGTAVRMNIDTLEIGSVEARLEQFRKEAPQIAKTHLGRAPRNPSYMSMLLRKDFRS
ncbi:MAG: hypothetical protein HXY30_02865 [Pseudorhodoplanes sp.]|nr:hypothetical protein [Pseudorhodoplanes sp.]